MPVGLGIATLISGLAGGTAAVYGAKKSSDANTKATKMQTDAAARTAELQLIAEREAADREAEAQKEAQAFLEKQWNVSQANMKPYMDLGSGAVTNLSAFMGIPKAQAASAATVPAATSSVAATSTPSVTGTNTQATDPAYVEQQIRASFQKWQGRDPTPQELEQWKGYALKPDTFSDGLNRVGWNGYWDSRIKTLGTPQSAYGDVSQAGMDTVIGRAAETTPSGTARTRMPLVTRVNALSDSGMGSPTATKTSAFGSPASSAIGGTDKLVWMVAPDGSVNRVKSSLVPTYMAKGATVLQA